MLKHSLTYFLLSAALLLQCNNLEAAHIQFEQTKLYAEVSARASSENKSFFVYFSAGWCGPCQIMNRTAFKDENLANFIDDHVIPVKVDIDQSVGKIWRDEFNVQAIPTIIFFDQFGDEQRRITSGVSGTKLLSILSEMDPNHQPANVSLPVASLVSSPSISAPSNYIVSSTDYSNNVGSQSNTSKLNYSNATSFELELGNFHAESDINFQIQLLSDRFQEHRFYIIQRQIPSGTIYQLILTGFRNKLEAQEASQYLQSKNLQPEMVKL